MKNLKQLGKVIKAHQAEVKRLKPLRDVAMRAMLHEGATVAEISRQAGLSPARVQSRIRNLNDSEDSWDDDPCYAYKNREWEYGPKGPSRATLRILSHHARNNGFERVYESPMCSLKDWYRGLLATELLELPFKPSTTKELALWLK